MIWHSELLETVLNVLNTDVQKGLPNGVADQRLNAYGSNSLNFSKATTFLKKFLSQLNNFATIALLAVAILSFVVTIISKDNQWIPPILIFTIVLLNAAVAAFEDIKSEDTADILKDYAAPNATVIRDGIKKIIDASALVPGDIVILKEGDYIAADCRLISASALCCDEAVLSGSHVPVDKVSDALCEDITPLDERVNMVYCGCSVTHGTATAVVVATGLESEIGKENIILQQSGAKKAPLKEGVAAFGKVFSLACLAVCALVFVICMISNLKNPNISRTLIDSFLNSMSLAVAVIPEALPTAISVTLALGVQRLLSKNIIVKDLSSIEKIGSVSVICADKTGTLTQNNMTVTKIWGGKEIIDISEDATDDIKMILELATICNDSTETSGDPTGMGIAEACKNICKMSKQDIENLYPRLGEIPFDSSRKLMTTINMINGRPFAIVKGAPENLIPICKGNADKISEAVESMAGDALRVIAVAAKQISEIPANPNPTELECELNFIGLIGLEDTPRPEAVKAVLDCKKAGIRTIMITGDYPATAKAIARRLGILTDDTEMLTNVELENMSDEELSENIEKYSVFARISSLDRLRIVKAWQSKGHAVAVTGDSVDDTPALMSADVGYSMGKNGTDVANGVADIIIADDDFASIVNSVKEGRSIYSNIKKVLNYLVSTNLGELIFVLFGVIIFGNTPLLAAQLLFINLLTDLIPVVAIGMEPPEKSVMDALPQKKQPLLCKKSIIFSLYQSGIFSFIALAALIIGKLVDTSGALGTTMAFGVLLLSQLFFALSVRTDDEPMPFSIMNNKFFLIFEAAAVLFVILVLITPIGTAFGLTAIPNFGCWLAVLLLSLVPFTVNEIIKTIKYFKK